MSLRIPQSGWIPAFAGMTGEQLQSQCTGERLEWLNLVNGLTWLTMAHTAYVAQVGNAIPGRGLREILMSRAHA